VQTVADDCSGDCQVSGAGTAANDFADLVYYICDLHLQAFCQLLAGKVFEQLAMGSGIFHIIIAHGFYISRTEYRTSVFRESIRSTFATLDASWS